MKCSLIKRGWVALDWLSTGHLLADDDDDDDDDVFTGWNVTYVLNMSVFGLWYAYVCVTYVICVYWVWCDMYITEEFRGGGYQIWRAESYQILEISTQYEIYLFNKSNILFKSQILFVQTTNCICPICYVTYV